MHIKVTHLTLATLIVCCSMASCILALSCSLILLNSSIKHRPLSATTKVPYTALVYKSNRPYLCNTECLLFHGSCILALSCSLILLNSFIQHRLPSVNTRVPYTALVYKSNRPYLSYPDCLLFHGFMYTGFVMFSDTVELIYTAQTAISQHQGTIYCPSL